MCFSSFPSYPTMRLKLPKIPYSIIHADPGLKSVVRQQREKTSNIRLWIIYWISRTSLSNHSFLSLHYCSCRSNSYFSLVHYFLCEISTGSLKYLSFLHSFLSKLHSCHLQIACLCKKHVQCNAFCLSPASSFPGPSIWMGNCCKIKLELKWLYLL